MSDTALAGQQYRRQFAKGTYTAQCGVGHADQMVIGLEGLVIPIAGKVLGRLANHPVGNQFQQLFDNGLSAKMITFKNFYRTLLEKNNNDYVSLCVVIVFMSIERANHVLS